MTSVSAIILTYNEEEHIERAIKSISRVASEIFVVDSFSSDKTVEIAKAQGAIVLEHEFVNYSKQFTWALENAPYTGEWLLRLDADEVVEPDLAAEILETLPLLGDDVTGISLNRKLIFMGRWIRHGGRFPMPLLRLWRRGKGRIEDLWMDEHIVVDSGRVVAFKGGFCDNNLKNLGFFTDKHNKYATREAIDILNRRLHLFAISTELTSAGTSRHAHRKRFAKTQIYEKIPFQVSALFYFLYRYFIQLGFLDRSEGLIYHFLQGFWYRFLVGAKLLELQRNIEGLTSPEDIRKALRAATGLNI